MFDSYRVSFFKRRGLYLMFGLLLEGDVYKRAAFISKLK